MSIFLPTRILELSTVEMDTKWFGTENDFCFICPKVDYEYVITRALLIHRVENAEAKKFESEWYDGDNERLGFKLEKVTENDHYTVFCHYAVERQWAKGTEDALAEFNLLLNARKEICESIKFH